MPTGLLLTLSQVRLSGIGCPLAVSTVKTNTQAEDIFCGMILKSITVRVIQYNTKTKVFSSWFATPRGSTAVIIA